MTDLRHRASQAFEAAFRDRLANAVQVAVLRGENVGVRMGCLCPLGCLTDYSAPGSEFLRRAFPQFTLPQFEDFIDTFELGCPCDSGTPEAALGLLYRERLMKRDL